MVFNNPIGMSRGGIKPTYLNFKLERIERIALDCRGKGRAALSPPFLLILLTNFLWVHYGISHEFSIFHAKWGPFYHPFQCQMRFIVINEISLILNRFIYSWDIRYIFAIILKALGVTTRTNIFHYGIKKNIHSVRKLRSIH